MHSTAVLALSAASPLTHATAIRESSTISHTYTSQCPVLAPRPSAAALSAASPLPRAAAIPCRGAIDCTRPYRIAAFASHSGSPATQGCDDRRTENLRLAEELAKKQALIDKLTTM